MSEKHDECIDDLVELIRDDYLMIFKKEEYKYPSFVLGDVDVLAIDYDRFDIYEVKTGNDQRTMKTAVDQLKKARSYLGQQGKEFLYTPKERIESIEKVIGKLKRRKGRRRKKQITKQHN